MGLGNSKSATFTNVDIAKAPDQVFSDLQKKEASFQPDATASHDATSGGEGDPSSLQDIMNAQVNQSHLESTAKISIIEAIDPVDKAHEDVLTTGLADNLIFAPLASSGNHENRETDNLTLETVHASSTVTPGEHEGVASSDEITEQFLAGQLELVSLSSPGEEVGNLDDDTKKTVEDAEALIVIEAPEKPDNILHEERGESETLSQAKAIVELESIPSPVSLTLQSHHEPDLVDEIFGTITNSQSPTLPAPLSPSDDVLLSSDQLQLQQHTSEPTNDLIQIDMDSSVTADVNAHLPDGHRKSDEEESLPCQAEAPVKPDQGVEVHQLVTDVLQSAFDLISIQPDVNVADDLVTIECTEKTNVSESPVETLEHKAVELYETQTSLDDARDVLIPSMAVEMPSSEVDSDQEQQPQDRHIEVVRQVEEDSSAVPTPEAAAADSDIDEN